MLPRGRSGALGVRIVSEGVAVREWADTSSALTRYLLIGQGAVIFSDILGQRDDSNDNGHWLSSQ